MLIVRVFDVAAGSSIHGAVGDAYRRSGIVRRAKAATTIGGGRSPRQEMEGAKEHDKACHICASCVSCITVKYTGTPASATNSIQDDQAVHYARVGVLGNPG
ncbi:hypothetical protein CMV_012423 [Castanea mollissima]|uniref:Uncharacterized protein n=1 Tax=Castanea mollissima TaxID=60419 RepID=A0A8J4VMZ7_9ROSI|nr:hypothetical protein CMV_012423 [Castanea mollissima]